MSRRNHLAKLLTRRSVLAVGMFTAACIGAALTAAPPPTTIDVTTIVHAYDSDCTATTVNLLLTRGDSLPCATYKASGKVKGVASRMNTSGGGWQLYLGNQSARTIWLTLASQNAPVPDGFYWDSVEVFSTCYTVDSSGSLVATGLVAIAPGTSNNMCNFGADFATSGTQYQLRMGPEKPGTGWATVSCNTLPPASACNSWTITPNTNAGNGNFPTVATLYKSTKNGMLAIGQYHNTFRVDVTNP